MISETRKPRAVQRCAPDDLQAILRFRNLAAHRAKIGCNRRESIGLLHPQLACIRDDRFSLRKRAGNRQDRHFIDHVGDFLASDLGATQTRATQLDRAERLRIVALNDFMNLCAHSQQHPQDACPGRIQADVPHQQ